MLSREREKGVDRYMREVLIGVRKGYERGVDKVFVDRKDADRMIECPLIEVLVVAYVNRDSNISIPLPSSVPFE